MGATLWYHEAQGYATANEALKALQATFLAEHYDLRRLLPQHLSWAKESVAAVERDGDEYGLLEVYKEKLELLERLNARPIPSSTEARIEIIRQLWSDSGEGIGNILDVTGISTKRAFPLAQELSPPEVTRLTGISKPSLIEARNSVGLINEVLGRGECVCFPVYEYESITGWFFVGNTLD